MKKMLLIAVAFVAISCITAPMAFAAPILNFAFVDSDQTLGPTDTVQMIGRITNMGPDSLTSAIGFGSFGRVPTMIYNQYIDDFPPGVSPMPSGLVSLAPGAYLDWLIVQWSPWPIGGNPGDPVSPGTYTFPSSDLSGTLFGFSGQNFNIYHVNMANASNFVWTVADNSPAPAAPVPEPGSFILLLIGVGMLVLARFLRRKESRNESKKHLK